MEKILIADHEEVNRNQLREILQDTYDVETAGTVEEVTNKLNRIGSEIATVLYRFSMQGLDGYGFLKKLDDHQLLNKLPVLFINERSAANLEHSPTKMGVYDFVHKPFVAEIVRRRVSNLAASTKRRAGSLAGACNRLAVVPVSAIEPPSST